MGEVARWTTAPEWDDADLVAGCLPLWLCVVLFHLLPQMHFVARLNMALFQHYESWEDLIAYWSMLARFMTSPQVALAWTHRLGC
eukprot:2628804-Amphidinium_carterae.1